jgi:ankyrin repeat protein
MEVKDYDGITPLHLAEEHDHEDCIALLRAYKEEKRAKSTKTPKVFIPIKKEEEEDLKQKVS